MPNMQCPFCLDAIQANCPTCEGLGTVPGPRVDILTLLEEEEAALEGGEWEVPSFPGWGPEDQAAEE